MRKVLVMTLLPLAACARDPGEARLRPDAQPTVRVAEAAIAANAPEVALNVTRNILRGDPFNVPAQLAQGAALYAVGDLAQSATAYRTVLTVQPRSAEAQLGIGRVHLARDEAREAEAAFRASLAIEARAPAWSNLGIALDMQDRHVEAQAAYREALKLDPRNEGARANLAVSAAIAAGLPLPAAPSGQAAMRLSAADPADPLSQPFAAAPGPRRLMHGGGDAVAQVRFAAAQLPAARPAFQDPASQYSEAQAPAAQLPASQPGELPVQPAAAASEALASAPDAVAQMVQVALSPGGQGLVPAGPEPEAAAVPPRRAAPRPAASPLPLVAASHAPRAVPPVELPVIDIATAIPAWPDAPGAGLLMLASAPRTFSMPWQETAPAPYPAAPMPTALREVATHEAALREVVFYEAALQPAAPAVAAAPVQKLRPTVAEALVRRVAAAPVAMPVAAAAAPPAQPAPVPMRAQAIMPSTPPAATPAAAPASVPPRPMLTQADRFDPALVPMPLVPAGARPMALAMATPVPAERSPYVEDGRWLRAAR